MLDSGSNYTACSTKIKCLIGVMAISSVGEHSRVNIYGDLYDRMTLVWLCSVKFTHLSIVSL